MREWKSPPPANHREQPTLAPTTTAPPAVNKPLSIFLINYVTLSLSTANNHHTTVNSHQNYREPPQPTLLPAAAEPLPNPPPANNRIITRDNGFSPSPSHRPSLPLSLSLSIASVSSSLPLAVGLILSSPLFVRLLLLSLSTASSHPSSSHRRSLPLSPPRRTLPVSLIAVVFLFFFPSPKISHSCIFSLSPKVPFLSPLKVGSDAAVKGSKN